MKNYTTFTHICQNAPYLLINPSYTQLLPFTKLTRVSSDTGEDGMTNALGISPLTPTGSPTTAASLTPGWDIKMLSK